MITWKLKPGKLLAVAGCAAIALFEVYSPALNGPFVLDDLSLPFASPEAERLPFRQWILNRPALMASYYANFAMSGAGPFSYHVTNVFLHFLTGLVVFAILRKWFTPALAGFGAGLFLFHPLQTEAVAYVASRSDVLSTLAGYGGLAFYLWRKRDGRAIGFVDAAVSLASVGCAVLAKEQAVVLPALFLLTDFFTGDRITRNWRLHLPVAAAGIAGGIWVLSSLRLSGGTAGFSVEGIRWSEYFLTQCRVIWRYLALAVVPLWQNVDPQVAVSRSMADPIVLAALAGLAAVSGAAWIFRGKFPMAVLGWFVWLALIAPTSSFVPLADVAAERRMYFPFLGLVLIALEGARRWNARPVAMAAILVVCAGLTWSRAAIWGDPIALWKDTVEKSPGKSRPHFQLAYAYYETQQYGLAVAEFERTAGLQRPDVRLLVDWALALDGAGKPDEALRKLEQAAPLDSGGTAWSQIGMIHGKYGRYDRALEALARAETAQPGFAMTYVYRGHVYRARGEFKKAAADYRRALGLDPGLRMAADGLRAVTTGR